MRKISFATRLFKEFILFARQHKMCWIIPLVLTLVLMALLIFVGQVAAPFIYTLF